MLKPAFRRFPILFTLAITCLTTALAGGTPSGTITVVDAFSPSNIGAGSTGTYRVQISNSANTPLTGVSFPVDLSKMATSILSGSSSCGGSATVTGTTATWSGATLAAAPSPTNPTICDFTFQYVAKTTSGTFTTSFPALALTTNEGLTNPNGSAASVTISPLQKLQTSLPSYIDPTYTLGDTVPFSFTIRNPNGVPVTGVSTTLTLGPNPDPYPGQLQAWHPTQTTINPATTMCTTAGTANPAATALLLSALNVPDPTRVGMTNFDMPANTTCTVGMNVVATIPQDGRATDTGYAPEAVDSFVKPTLNPTTNTTDPVINAPAITNMQYNIPIGYAVGKSFNGNNSYSPAQNPTAPITMEIGLQNNSLSTGTFNFTDNLPAGLTLDPTPTLGSGSSAGCSTNGITVSSTSVSFGNVTLASKARCTYVFKVTAYPSTTTIINKIPNVVFKNATTQSGPPYDSTYPFASSYNTSAQATLSALPGQVVSKSGGTYPEYGYGYYTISITNRAYYAISDLSFNDSWTHNLLIDPRISTTQCGGTLTINPDRKGFVFTGGKLAAAVGTTYPNCALYIPIDPASGARGSYPNTTGNFTFTAPGGAGVTLSPVSATLNYVGRTIIVKYLNQNEPLIVGQQGYVTTTFTNKSSVTANDITTFDSGPNANFDTTAPIYVSCPANYRDGTPAPIPSLSAYTVLDPSQYTMTATGIQIKTSVPGVSTPTSFSPYVSNYSQTCYYRLPMKGISVGNHINYSSSKDAVTGANTTNTNYPSYNPLSYSVSAPNTYAVSKAFSPQTVVAGQITNLSFSLTKQSGSIGDGLSSDFAEITDILPEGMQVDLSRFAPNQADGSYRSPDLVPNSAVTGNPYQTQLPCLEISPDRFTIIQRCRANTATYAQYNSIPILITKYGDLINTITPQNVKAFYGSVTAPASISAKATRGVALTKSFSPATIKYGQVATMTISLYNATVIGEAPNTIALTDPFPAGMEPVGVTGATVPLTGDCQGASATWDSLTRRLSLSGIVMQPQTKCSVSLGVTPSSKVVTNTAQTNTIAANAVTSSSGSSNPSSTSATLTTVPLNQCTALPVTVTAPTGFVAGQSSQLTFELNNTGESAITAATTALTPLNSNSVYTIQFGDAQGSTSATTAWNNYLAKYPTGLPLGKTSVTVTFAVPSTAQDNSQVGATFTFNPTDGASCGTQTTTLSAIVVAKPEPSIVKEQFLCGKDATCANPVWQKTDIKPQPCDYLLYRITAINLSGGPLNAPQIRDIWPQHLTFISASASSTKPLLWVTGGTSSSTAPTSLQSGETITVFVDTDGNQQRTKADQLLAGEAFELQLKGRVGENCLLP